MIRRSCHNLEHSLHFCDLVFLSNTQRLSLILCFNYKPLPYRDAFSIRFTMPLTFIFERDHDSAVILILHWFDSLDWKQP